MHPAVWKIFSGINPLDGRQMPEQFLVMSENLPKIKFPNSPYAKQRDDIFYKRIKCLIFK